MAVQYRFKTQNFTILYTDEEEQEFDLSWDETGEARTKLDSGEWQMFVAKVAVLFRGREIASESLGGCIHADPVDFRDHVGTRGAFGSYFKDMVHAAIAEARATLKDMRRHPLTLSFLLAYLVYNDGIQTVISQASVYGSEELNLDQSTLISLSLKVAE